MPNHMLQSAQAHAQVVAIVALLYALSLVALRFVGRRVRSHLRPIDLTALILMTDVLRAPLSLDDKGSGAEIAVALTLCVCVRITTLIGSGRWMDRLGVWLLEPVSDVRRPMTNLASAPMGARLPSSISQATWV